MEIWKDVVGYEGLYMVSNKGRIKSLVGWNGVKYIRRERLMKPTIQKSNSKYTRYRVNLTKNKKRKLEFVHRLVAAAFIPNIDNKPEVNHIDCNPLNNNVVNLEWCTRKENMVHAYKCGNGRKLRIDKNTLVELYRNQNMTQKQIGEMYGTTSAPIRSLMKKYGIERKHGTEIRTKYNIESKWLMNELKHKTQRQIAIEIGCDKSLISHYKKRLKERGSLYAK